MIFASNFELVYHHRHSEGTKVILDFYPKHAFVKRKVALPSILITWYTKRWSRGTQNSDPVIKFELQQMALKTRKCIVINFQVHFKSFLNCATREATWSGRLPCTVYGVCCRYKLAANENHMVLNFFLKYR